MAGTPLFKTAPPTFIQYKNLLTISQVFQVKEAPKFKSVSNINKGIKSPYYSFKIFSWFWLAKSTRIIPHNQLLNFVFNKGMTSKKQFLAG